MRFITEHADIGLRIQPLVDLMDLRRDELLASFRDCVARLRTHTQHFLLSVFAALQPGVSGSAPYKCEYFAAGFAYACAP